MFKHKPFLILFFHLSLIYANLPLQSLIDVHPQNDTALEGQEARFSVVPSEPSVSYQWQRNDGILTTITGATSDTLKFTAAPGDDGAYFRCIVSKDALHDTSSFAKFILATLPTFSSSFPLDTIIPVGGSLIISGNATGVPAPSFKWFIIPPSSPTPVSIASGKTLYLLNAQKTDSGTIYLVASNKFGSTSSDSMFVHVVQPVSFTVNLTINILALEGGQAKLSVSAAGDGTINYQWYENDIVMTGETNPMLTINPVDSTLHDGNTYHCVTWNVFNGATVSTATSTKTTMKVSRLYNPFTIKVERIDIINFTQVRVSVWSDADITTFPNNPSPAPWADSLWLMYKTLGYPLSVQQAATLLFSIQEIKQTAPDTLKKILTVQKLDPGGVNPFPHDSCYWFSHSVLWHIAGSGDTLPQPFVQGNNVFMLDTTGIDHPPVIMPIGNKTIPAGYLLSFTVSATDANGDPIALAAGPLPTGATFFDSGNGSGIFLWQPDTTQIGLHLVPFTATAGSLTDHDTILIMVEENTAITCPVKQQSRGLDFTIIPNPASRRDGTVSFVYGNDKAVQSILLTIYDPVGNKLYGTFLPSVNKGIFHSWDFKNRPIAAGAYYAALEVHYDTGERAMVNIVFGIAD